MVMMRNGVIAAVMSMAGLTAAQTVEFFYTDTVDLCEISGASMAASEQTTHGGLCAYRKDTARIYGCPAPDPTCWTWYEDCTSSNVGQTVCNRDGSVWCCNAVAGETCTTTQGQINICISNFTSPNSGVSVDQANKVYLDALGVSNVTATSQSVDPTPFSTRTLDATTSTSSSATSSSPTTSTTSGALNSATKSSSGSSNTGSTSASAGAASTSDTSISPSSPSSGISGGAIAGIIIAVLIILALAGALFFVVRRQKKNKQQLSAPPSEMPYSTPAPYVSSPSNEKLNHGGYYQVHAPASELGSDGTSLVEMPATTKQSGPAPTRYELA